MYIFLFHVNSFVLHIRQTKIWKILKFPGNGICCVHFCVSRKYFRFTYTSNIILKNTEFPEIFPVHFYVPCEVFCFTYTPSANLKNTRISSTWIWRVHFYVLRNFFCFMYTSNANLNIFKPVKRILCLIWKSTEIP